MVASFFHSLKVGQAQEQNAPATIYLAIAGKVLASCPHKVKLDHASVETIPRLKTSHSPQARPNPPITPSLFAAMSPILSLLDAASACSRHSSLSQLADELNNDITCISDETTQKQHRRRHGVTGQQRKVRFADAIAGIVVPSLADMTEGERAKIWYIDQEKSMLLANMLKEAEQWRRRRSSSSPTETDHSTSRGTEHMSCKKTFKALCESRSASISIVLEEQRRQRSVNISDSLLLAKLYTEGSKQAKKIGIALAAIDQEFVTSTYAKNSDRCQRRGTSTKETCINAMRA